MYLVFMEVSLHGDMMYVRKCTMFDVRKGSVVVQGLFGTGTEL